MLTRLSISNYLLIEELELDLRKGLTAITGGTGSGKCTLLCALGLAIGDRMDGNVARDPQRKCVVEVAVGKDLKTCFAENELPCEPRMQRAR